MAFLRIGGLFLVALTIVFACLWFWFRAGEKARLHGAWARDQPPLPEHTFVENGLRDYMARLKPRLVVGVYVLPTAALFGLIYYVNYA